MDTWKGWSWAKVRGREEEGRREGAPSSRQPETKSPPPSPGPTTSGDLGTGGPLWAPRPGPGGKDRPDEDLVPLPVRLQTGQRRLWRVQRVGEVSRVTMAAGLQARVPPPPVHLRVELSPRCARPAGWAAAGTAASLCCPKARSLGDKTGLLLPQAQKELPETITSFLDQTP